MADIKYQLIDDAAYKGKFLFLYKEANISEDEGRPNCNGVQWLREYIAGTNTDQISKTAATKLLRQAFIAKEVFDNGNMSLEDIVAKAQNFADKNLLASVGFLNIVKEGGGKSSDNRKIIKYLEDHKDEIVKEIMGFWRKGKDLHIFIPLGYHRSAISNNTEFERIKNALALPSDFLLIPIPHYARASYLSVAEAMIRSKG